MLLLSSETAGLCHPPQVQTPLFDTSVQQFADNATFLQHDFGSLLTGAFPHLDAGTIQAFVMGLFDQSKVCSSTCAGLLRRNFSRTRTDGGTVYPFARRACRSSKHTYEISSSK